MTRFRNIALFACLCGLFIPLSTAQAWNDTGHKVVARIAWDNMTPQARKRSVALMQDAPVDSGLASLFSRNTRALAIREREFFLRAATWPDLARDNEDYHQGNWHYINYIWDQRRPGRAARERTDLKPPPVNIVTQLESLSRSFADEKRETPQRAVDLAWILHLIGDIHQPLHTSARITAQPEEKEGDRGGNLFKLCTCPNPPNLHGYWDNILDRARPRQRREADADYINRLAAEIVKLHPKSKLSKASQPEDYRAWARAGFKLTMAQVYRSLSRNHEPSAAYRQKAFKTSQVAIALAGYRLADLLNRKLG